MDKEKDIKPPEEGHEESQFEPEGGHEGLQHPKPKIKHTRSSIKGAIVPAAVLIAALTAGKAANATDYGEEPDTRGYVSGSSSAEHYIDSERKIMDGAEKERMQKAQELLYKNYISPAFFSYLRGANHQKKVDEALETAIEHKYDLKYTIEKDGTIKVTRDLIQGNPSIPDDFLIVIKNGYISHAGGIDLKPIDTEDFSKNVTTMHSAFKYEFRKGRERGLSKMDSLKSLLRRRPELGEFFALLNFDYPRRLVKAIRLRGGADANNPDFLALIEKLEPGSDPEFSTQPNDFEELTNRRDKKGNKKALRFMVTGENDYFDIQDSPFYVSPEGYLYTEVDENMKPVKPVMKKGWLIEGYDAARGLRPATPPEESGPSRAPEASNNIDDTINQINSALEQAGDEDVSWFWKKIYKDNDQIPDKPTMLSDINKWLQEQKEGGNTEAIMSCYNKIKTKFGLGEEGQPGTAESPQEMGQKIIEMLNGPAAGKVPAVWKKIFRKKPPRRGDKIGPIEQWIEEQIQIGNTNAIESFYNFLNR